MSAYSSIPSELDVQSGLVREFSTKLRKLKDLTSHGPLKGTPDQISKEHESALKVSKEILTSFRRNPPNREQKLQHNKLTKEFEDLLKQFDVITKKIATNQTQVIEEKIVKEEEDPEMKKIKQVGHLNEVVLKERNEDITLLAQDITEVNSMYKEVAHMVEEQGIKLTEAEKNTDVAVKETERAVGDLSKANESQKSAKEKLVVICVLIVIVIVFIVLIILGYLYF